MRDNYFFKIVKFLRSSCLAGFIFSSNAFVNPSVASTYSVGPLLTIVNIKDSQARGTIDVSNPGKEPIRLRIYVGDFTYDRDKGFTPVKNHPFSAVPYLQFTPRELTIPPQTTRNVRVNILIPANAPDGEYRAVVFAEELKSEQTPQAGGAVAFNVRIGSIFYVSKGNNSFDITANSVGWNSEKKQPQLILENKGLASSNPGLQWKISRDGQEVDGGNIPGLIVQNRSERSVNLNTKKAGKLTAGEYVVSGQVILRNGDVKPFSFKLKVTD